MKEIGVVSRKLPHVKCLANIFVNFSPSENNHVYRICDIWSKQKCTLMISKLSLSFNFLSIKNKVTSFVFLRGIAAYEIVYMTKIGKLRMPKQLHGLGMLSIAKPNGQNVLGYCI